MGQLIQLALMQESARCSLPPLCQAGITASTGANLAMGIAAPGLIVSTAVTAGPVIVDTAVNTQQAGQAVLNNIDPAVTQNVTSFIETQGPSYTPATNVGSTLGNLWNLFKAVMHW
jgi:hypothetical protein